MNQLDLKVSAMHCDHCVHTVKMELSDLDGVGEVDVDLENKQVKVMFESPATETEIRGVLKEINYPPDM